MVLSESGVKYAKIKYHFKGKNSPKSFKTNMPMDFDVKGQQGMDFLKGGSVIMDYGLAKRKSLS